VCIHVETRREMEFQTNNNDITFNAYTYINRWTTRGNISPWEFEKHLKNKYSGGVYVYVNVASQKL
jgi:hypothetical protein